MKTQKWLSLLLAAALALGCLTACGGAGGSSLPAENTFTWWLQQGEDSEYYGEYENNPSWQYILSREYAGEKLAIDFSIAPAGAAQDNFNQMLATGEYLDIVNLGGLVTQSALDLHSEGILLDLTELVQQYMPNYWSLIQSDPALAEVAWDTVEGEQRLLQIYGFRDAPQANFQGYMYRRDWVAKYGTNPSTGEAFTYGYTDENDVESWADTVLFPSFYGLSYQDGVLIGNSGTKAFMEQYALDYPDYDGSWPVTVTDWEWMFEIFDKAHADLGIDNYHVSLYYPGYNSLGGLNASFGGGSPWWYNDGGTIRYGGTEDAMRAYVQCMNQWYDRGWLDADFNTRTDMFYQIDTPATYQGEVGMFIGQKSQSGAQMDTGDGYTKGIMIFGCPYPVNDVYGGDTEKYVIPNSYYAYSRVLGSIGITNAAEDKNLGLLLTMLDHLYSPEGAHLKHGMTREEAEAFGSETFLSYLPNGAYYLEERNGESWFVLTEEFIGKRDMGNAMKPNRTPVGLEILSRCDQGLDRYTQMLAKFWDLYPTDAVITDPMKAKLSPDEQKTRSKIENNMNTYMQKTIPMFIKGELDVNGADWDDCCSTQNKYGVQKMTDIYQAVYDAMK